MDSRSPPLELCTKRKTRVKCLTIIQQEPDASDGHIVTTFEFYRFRFHFRALDQVHFPQGKSANVVRGAFGSVLRDAVPPEVYARLFEPGKSLGAAPSGLADWPRPFVLRVAHLDGLTVPAGDSFYLDAHVFDLHRPTLVHFRAALSRLAEKGLGPGRGRAELERTEQLDVAGAAQAVWETSAAPIVANLDPEPCPVERVTIRFQTPTELKSAGGLAERPEFAIVFGRLRDRISTLRSLYGAGALDIDFEGLGERAARVELRRSDLAWEQVKRKSGRTGQVHPIGGFTGEAEYAGDLAEFLPWLRAARWVGVGRQTVWGKGDVRVL
jgi:CRISPR-associated endoribonuclease Cas6